MGGDGGGPAGLSCWGRAPTHLGETVEMDRCVSPCWHFFPSALLGSFFHVCWVGGGREMVLPLPQHLPLPRKSPFPPLPNRRQRKGREVGGQGSPSVLRLHRVFRLNQEIFYYQKEKRKKKIPAATFPPCPIGTVETGSVGFPGRVAQGWNTLRQEWWSSLSGPPPGPLWASPLSFPPSPASKPPEVAFL